MWQIEIMQKFSTMDIKVNELLSMYTYTKTGGYCDVLIFPTSKEEIRDIVLWAKIKNVPITILGNASNVIVKDSGIRGIVIMFDRMIDLVIEGHIVRVESGVTLVELAKRVADQSLTGLEFACGIPGNVGGGTFMNAGAYGGELKDVIESVEVVTSCGEFKVYDSQEMMFGYRQSLIQHTKDIVVSVTLKLNFGSQADILSRMQELTMLREHKQPLEYPSCGSVFKRPEGYFAGKLIQDAGLQGYRIGGVEVSKKHAGFMVNIDNGTASDYKHLIEHVQKIVYQKYRVQLETEVRFIGE